MTGAEWTEIMHDDGVMMDLVDRNKENECVDDTEPQKKKRLNARLPVIKRGNHPKGSRTQVASKIYVTAGKLRTGGGPKRYRAKPADPAMVEDTDGTV